MTSLCQSFPARKIRVTQLRTVPQASPKALFVIGSILEVLEHTSLKRTVNRTQGTGFVFISLLHLDGWKRTTHRYMSPGEAREYVCKKE